MKKAGIQAIGIPAVNVVVGRSSGWITWDTLSASKSYEDNIKRIREILNQNKVDLVISNTANVFQGALAAS